MGNLKVDIIPCLSDNYSYIVSDRNQALVIDPSESKPIIDFLEKNNLELKFVLNTHHHFDHVGGNLELKNKYKILIAGNANDKKRIPGIDILLNYKENEKDNLISKSQNPGADSMTKILSSKKKIDVVVYADDLFALDAHIFCKKNNIKIKKDISIVTFSGTIPETFDVNPSITSIDMDHKKVGLLAAELLVKKINNKDYKKLNYIKPNFIIGGSA